MGAHAVVVVVASMVTFAAIFPVTRFIMEGPMRSREADMRANTAPSRFAGEPTLDVWWQSRLRRMPVDASDVGEVLEVKRSVSQNANDVLDSAVPQAAGEARKPQSPDVSTANSAESGIATSPLADTLLSSADWANIVRSRMPGVLASMFTLNASLPAPLLTIRITRPMRI
jgi:hypothetical protein